MLHNAPQGFSMVLAGHPDIYGFAFYAWYALYCIAFCLAVPKMLFREHLCARFWHRLGLESCWGSGVSQPCPAVLHKAFPWYWPVHPNIYGFAFYALYYLLFSSSEDAISRASLRTLLAPPWA